MLFCPLHQLCFKHAQYDLSCCGIHQVYAKRYPHFRLREQYVGVVSGAGNHETERCEGDHSEVGDEDNFVQEPDEPVGDVGKSLEEGPWPDQSRQDPEDDIPDPHKVPAVVEPGVVVLPEGVWVRDCVGVVPGSAPEDPEEHGHVSVDLRDGTNQDEGKFDVDEVFNNFSLDKGRGASSCEFQQLKVCHN